MAGVTCTLSRQSRMEKDKGKRRKGTTSGRCDMHALQAGKAEHEKQEEGDSGHEPRGAMKQGPLYVTRPYARVTVERD